MHWYIALFPYIACTGTTFLLVYYKMHRYFAAGNTKLFEPTPLLVDFCVLLSVHNYSCLVGIDLELLLLLLLLLLLSSSSSSSSSS